MNEYLSCNKEYWSKGYAAGNVESHIFRMFGRILKYEFGQDGTHGERTLDFGCGQGATSFFFRRNGYEVFGVDISEVDIDVAKQSIPDQAGNFLVIPSKPSADDMFFGGNFDLITASQSLYYLDNDDLAVRLNTLNNMLKDDGFVYFTMMGKKHYMFEHAKEDKNGLWKVDFNLPRLEAKNYYLQFMDSEEDMVEKFKIFEPIHIGYYDHKLRSDEGSGFHYTFFGRKKRS